MVNNVADKVMEKFGRIGILINNAGTGAVAPAEDTTDAQFAGEMDVDLFGTFKMARAVAEKAMIAAKYGRVINIASMYGLVGNKKCRLRSLSCGQGGVVNLTRAGSGVGKTWHQATRSVCCAHLLRELIGIKENHPEQFWAPLFLKLLLKMSQHGKAQSCRVSPLCERVSWLCSLAFTTSI